MTESNDHDDPSEGTGNEAAYDGQAVKWLQSDEGQAEAAHSRAHADDIYDNEVSV